jgi:L,D-peptidoglycan transpeptidase YkuD (ErfK/YbiS/YcfS/YnhG family)
MRQLDLISVCPQGDVPHCGCLTAGGIVLPCALGRSGVREAKREGDGASPAGTWPLRRVLFRPDRIEPPATDLPVSAISPDDGWCDDPADPHYNRLVRLPHGASAEALWRDDELYDVVVVLGYNDDPPRPGLGSAIFFHLATPDFAPTAGCVAVHRPDMIRLLAYCGPGTKLEIAGAPHATSAP